MTFKAIDRAKEQASTSGAGNFTLPGAPASPEFQSFVTKLTANGDRTFYCAVAGNQWETGLLTRVDAVTFSRTVSDNSSNTAVAINFTAAPVVFSTVPGAALAPLGGPAFSASASGTQNVPASTFTKVVLTTEEYDTNDCFDAPTSRFTAKTKAIYNFSGVVNFGTTTASANTLSALFKNGVEYRRGGQIDSNNWGQPVAADVLLNVGDFIELYVFTGTARVLNAAPLTYLTGHLVRYL